MALICLGIKDFLCMESNPRNLCGDGLKESFVMTSNLCSFEMVLSICLRDYKYLPKILM
jgi:hypothetical protein